MLEKLNGFSFNHADQADRLSDSLTADEVKEAFDSRGEELRVAFNAFIDALQNTASGDSGAVNIGASAIDGLTGSTVQALLQSIRDTLKGNAGAAFVGAGTIEGLAGSTVQALLEALKGYIDAMGVVSGQTYVSKIELSGARKLSASGDFTGSWFGVTNPAMSDPGIAGLVQLHTAQLADDATKISALQVGNQATMFVNINAILPPGFPTLPFNLIFDDDQNATCDWDLNQFKTGADTTIYVNRQTGSDTTGDGSSGNPYQFVFKAWDVLQTLTWTKAVINIDGEFKRGDMPASGWTIPAGKTLSIVGKADGSTVIYSDRANLLTWTADGASYKATRSSCFNVVDIKGSPDSNGIYPPLTQVTSVALCQSTPGSWYTDNVTVWVHTSDNRQPDIQVELVIANSELNFNLGAGSTVYLEALNVRAGHVAPNGTNGQGRFVQKNVKISLAGGTQSNGLAVNNVKECYSFNCITAYASDDGLNYHYAATPTPRQALAFESECISYSNGRDTGDQASTCHEGASVLRMNGTYTGLTGTAITDVNGCDTVILGCILTSTIGEAVRVSDTGSRITMINSKAFCQPGWASIRAYEARLRNNIVNQATNIVSASVI